ncbi:DUF1127 domain-containing protein [Phyllobacterium myrsinacearum]|uniref:Uncharacterized protein YjiS (DUF1127 family) n=1 Tax=Phyllobacterium myrsinacearum TaxID=28101 RepID=A0A839EJ27_9HYPH|nr:DUF1127 domain-containing protein [Phyllobacterium myrsinacearum]MBA8878348.1 uncharacterized protein YjiS (DUF1127 family) [Phyllobacterium myrsinacearum]
MSSVKTTGLLLNKIDKPSNSDWRQNGDAFVQSLRKTLTVIWSTVRYRTEGTDGQRVSKLSDHLLADIGITRQEAKEIDRQKR